MRNLIKRRMRESYRTRKHSLIAATEATGRHIDIAFICQPAGAKGTTGTKGTTGGKGAQKSASGKVAARVTEIPDFKTIDHAVARILEKILARS